MSQRVVKFTSFACMMTWPLASAVAEEKAVLDVAEDTDSSWKYLVRLNKFERQFSTSNDDQHAEWGGFIVIGNDPSAF